MLFNVFCRTEYSYASSPGSPATQETPPAQEIQQTSSVSSTASCPVTSSYYSATYPAENASTSYSYLVPPGTETTYSMYTHEVDQAPDVEGYQPVDQLSER